MATFDQAETSPSKHFFVSMLTRDIDLVDAILDLVDNSLDGALRMGADQTGYDKFGAEVIVEKDNFWISDNCGGIPREIAARYAFKMGREGGDPRDDEHATIGMYGIGMKRAIFKMGTRAHIDTNHNGDRFLVRITPEWLSSSKWDPLPFEAPRATDGPQEPGTMVVVDQLTAGVAAKFGSDPFVAKLRRAFSEHFTLFLQRGFVIKLNGEKVVPTTVRMLLDLAEEAPKPYYSSVTVGGTKISLAIGINGGISDGGDLSDASNFTHERAVPSAGWSIFCNDRAVLVGDKSRLTGWGDGVPMFHPQFNMITGVIEFRANNAKDLPVTTTKRALDTSSEVWLRARPLMREATKVIVGHTNRWKNHSKEEQAPAFATASQVSLDEVESYFKDRPGLLATKRGPGKAKFYDPVRKKVLPTAPRAEAANRRIVFSRPSEEVKAVGLALLDDDKARPSDVGAAAFDEILEGVRNGER